MTHDKQTQQDQQTTSNDTQQPMISRKTFAGKSPDKFQLRRQMKISRLGNVSVNDEAGQKFKTFSDDFSSKE